MVYSSKLVISCLLLTCMQIVRSAVGSRSIYKIQKETIPGCRAEFLTPHGHRWIDLRDVSQPKGQASLTLKFEDGDQFLFNPCYKFDVKTSSSDEQCKNTHVAFERGSRSCTSYGDNPKFELNPQIQSSMNLQDIVKVTYKRADGLSKGSSTVLLLCDESGFDEFSCLTNETSCSKSNSPVFQLRSTACCFKSEQLSFGSILDIVFFSILVLYFIFGTCVGQIKGRRGLDKLPHSVFWMELPYLVRDGIVFACCCKCSKLPNSNYHSLYDAKTPIVSV